MSDEYWSARLNAEQAISVWERAAPLLAPAVDRGPGLYTIEDVRDLVTRPYSGTEHAWSLWILAEQTEMLAAWTTHVIMFPRAKVLAIPFAGGVGFRRYVALAIDETEKFAREIGCSRMHGGGRKGWAHFGFEPIGYWHERVLP
jgi:hypothetical protein